MCYFNKQAQKLKKRGTMMTPIAKQISTRMKAKDISVRILEKEAGLKSHAVQNILRGNSKKPSAEILQAVADVLRCTVKDLLNKQEIFQEDETSELTQGLINNTYDHPALLLETVQWINEREAHNKLTVKQALTCVEEIYLHSLRRDPTKVDQAFAEWFFELIID